MSNVYLVGELQAQHYDECDQPFPVVLGTFTDLVNAKNFCDKKNKEVNDDWKSSSHLENNVRGNRVAVIRPPLDIEFNLFKLFNNKNDVNNHYIFDYNSEFVIA